MYDKKNSSCSKHPVGDLSLVDIFNSKNNVESFSNENTSERILGLWYYREKWDDTSFFDENEMVFFVYLLKKVQYGATIVNLTDNSCTKNIQDIEERVFHFRNPVEQLPEKLAYINSISEGDWRYELDVEEYERLKDEKSTNLYTYLTYGLSVEDLGAPI